MNSQSIFNLPYSDLMLGKYEGIVCNECLISGNTALECSVIIILSCDASRH